MSLIGTSSIRGPNSVVKVKHPSERRSMSRSATRALDVLEYFGAERRPLRAIEISKVLGMNPSTANQLLKTMVDSGHLVFDAQCKTYLPSPRLTEFSGWIAQTYGAGGLLRKLIGAIQQQTGLVVTVTTPNDLFMQIIDSAIPEGKTASRGLRVSLLGSAIGSAYLSMLDDAGVSRLANRARVPDTQLKALLEGVARIREDGFADGPSTDGEVWSIAMPLPMSGLRVPTVLGIAGSPEEIRPRCGELVAIMQESVTRLLGGPVCEEPPGGAHAGP
ncbi:helix-turn-helix domain-containing protein [Novosphingobium sp. G106]|uniref:IclR family transcriptional regulator n=1 Tax=Novosphingobium sp. G106 TaxID=2849500 RepID=UPI001C2D275C|nr:helix-turn-helix domain-containing protein [Novosphingobium sp. G106]MBV1687844.1 helix-turn-helix domain-containing protein [Novosphingobium sp. G106]